MLLYGACPIFSQCRSARILKTWPKKFLKTFPGIFRTFRIFLSCVNVRVFSGYIPVCIILLYDLPGGFWVFARSGPSGPMRDHSARNAYIMYIPCAKIAVRVHYRVHPHPHAGRVRRCAGSAFSGFLKNFEILKNRKISKNLQILKNCKNGKIWLFPSKIEDLQKIYVVCPWYSDYGTVRNSDKSQPI